MRNEILAGKRGLFCHYLFPLLFDADGERATDLDRTVASFDVDRFAGQLKKSRSNHLIFTFGQNSGYYVAPNAVVDAYAGGGHCSRRDLVGEIIEALTARGILFIGYLPCEVRANCAMHAGFRWTTRRGTAQTEFQKRYLEMISFWAKRYGKKLAGWWFDGCYAWPWFHHRFLKIGEWLEAARAGNPDAVVSFNDGSFLENSVMPVFREQDYISGEANDLRRGWPVLAKSGKVYRFSSPFCPGTKTLRHLTLPIDALWWHGNEESLPGCNRITPLADRKKFEKPAFTDGELNQAIRHFCGVGGAATFNAAIRSDGLLAPETIDQLARLEH
ncbi:MAG: hypothetical protein MJ016_06630 [Victivallaceae bacterium]|nr:hypothetical protein [Victivallaceae bacterium]